MREKNFEILYNLLLRKYTFGNISVSSVSRELNYSPSTIYRYLNVMERDIKLLNNQS